MTTKKNNSFMKWFTIFLIIVFLAGTLGTGVLVLTGPSQNTTETTNK